mgnify:CR=1 FL=1
MILVTLGTQDKSFVRLLNAIEHQIQKGLIKEPVFEYMALKKPIVTTNMYECRKYITVLIGEDHQDFIEKLKIAYENKDDQKYLKLLDNEAKENDWSKKATAIVEMLIL